MVWIMPLCMCLSVYVSINLLSVFVWLSQLFFSFVLFFKQKIFQISTSQLSLWLYQNDYIFYLVLTKAVEVRTSNHYFKCCEMKHLKASYFVFAQIFKTFVIDVIKSHIAET